MRGEKTIAKKPYCGTNILLGSQPNIPARQYSSVYTKYIKITFHNVLKIYSTKYAIF